MFAERVEAFRIPLQIVNGKLPRRKEKKRRRRVGVFRVTLPNGNRNLPRRNGKKRRRHQQNKKNAKKFPADFHAKNPLSRTRNLCRKIIAQKAEFFKRAFSEKKMRYTNLKNFRNRY